MKRPRNRRRQRPRSAAAASTSHAAGCYVCQSCGEAVVIPLDLSGGLSQSYVEDCPVCCRPHVVHVELDGIGGGRVWAEAE